MRSTRTVTGYLIPELKIGKLKPEVPANTETVGLIITLDKGLVNVGALK